MLKYCLSITKLHAEYVKEIYAYTRELDQGVANVCRGCLHVHVHVCFSIYVIIKVNWGYWKIFTKLVYNNGRAVDGMIAI